MAFEKFSSVDKVNKGTSRNEWGVLNYHGYKTRDGKIRARLYPPDDNGKATFVVRKFELPANSWRRKVIFEDAIEIGSCMVDHPDADKGYTSDEAVKMINTLIEIHNDYFDANVGRKVRVKNYSGEYSVDAVEITGVSFNINANDETSVIVHGSRWRHNIENVIDYTDDFAKQHTLDQFAEVQAKINAAQAYLNECRTRFNSNERIERTKTGYGSNEGLIDHVTADTLARLVNDAAPKSVEVTAV